jgi:hypothetical protein
MAMQPTRHPWHVMVEQLAADRLPTLQIVERVQADFPDVRRTQIDGHLQRYRRHSVIGDNPAVAEWEDRRDRAKEDLRRQAEVYDWLRPVELPAPERARVMGKPNGFTLVIGDMHFPKHDERTLAIFIQTVAALKPQRVILNGDTVDLLAVSKYPKDARRRFKWELRDEVAAFHGFLRELHTIGDAWGLEVVETDSNHAGNGTGGRWWRYLSDRCPELLGHSEAEERLSYQSWFYPRWSTIRLVESVVIADDLLVLHGDMVRGKGGYTARAHMEKWQSSTLNNHTHRAGSTVRRIPAVGSRGEGVQRSYEIGCACDLSPVYASVPDWANAFGVIAHDATSYGVEIVHVTNGRASVAALGASLVA